MNEGELPTGLNVILNGYAWWLLVPLAAGLGYLIAKLYFRETAPHARSGSILRALRVAVVVLLVLLLSQPVIHNVSARYEPPVVIVLRDQSSSMNVKDTHEKVEKKIRAAAGIGLLDAKLRDTSADKAAAMLSGAQSTVETAAAGLRQAIQQLQEGGASSGDAAEKLSAARKTLSAASKEISNATELIHKAQPQNAASKCAQTAARIEKELADVSLQNADARKLLADKSQSLKLLSKDLNSAANEARQLQDKNDRALAEGGNAEVKKALAELEKMDRSAVMLRSLEKALAPAGDKIRFVSYNIDTDLHSLPDSKEPKDPKEEAAGKNPKNDARMRSDTDLATPLLKLAERHAQETVSAVVLCSDGRHTSGPIPEDAARALAARGITLHTLGVGSVDAPPDVCVARLEGTLSVFLEETIHLTAHIKSNGYKDKKCKMVLRRGDQVIETRELTLPADGWMRQNFDLVADKRGAHSFSASIEPLPNETLISNNSAEAVVDVANDRLRVLLIDELPRWETRYVASLLRRERKMELVERWLVNAQTQGIRLKALPDDAPAQGNTKSSSLEEFDVVILGDVPAERLDEAAQKRLAQYVSDRGGFLIVIAGQKSMPRSYVTGSLSDLLPIKQNIGSALSASDAAERIRVKLSEDGGRNEIVRVLRDPALNDQLWTALPELHWVSRPASPKPGAVSLLNTDDARKDSILAVHNYGAGRVMYLGTDNTWRWRFKVADRVHAVFWSQVMRWGTGNRLVGNDRLKVGVDRRQIRPGDNLEVLARPRDKQGRSIANAVVVAEVEDQTRRQRVQLQPVADSGGLYRGFLQNLSAGVHNVKVKIEGADGEAAEETLQIIAREVAGQEGVELTRDSVRLAAMANSGGGKNRDILEASELFQELAAQGKYRPQESSYELWSSYWALILVVVLLAAEWMLRKRVGLA